MYINIGKKYFLMIKNVLIYILRYRKKFLFCILIYGKIAKLIKKGFLTGAFKVQRLGHNTQLYLVFLQSHL